MSQQPRHRPLTCFSCGGLRAVITRSPEIIQKARLFRAASFGVDPFSEVDVLDDICEHVLIECGDSGVLLCYFRMLLVKGEGVQTSYAARFYNLARLEESEAPMLEIGRFCMAPGQNAHDVLRLAWAVIGQQVDQTGTELLFGCSSFAGTNPSLYSAAFAHLASKHRAPERWTPERASCTAFDLGSDPDCAFDRTKALRQMPSLLRAYLTLGGWVSSHGVIDQSLGTMHVFTGVEIDAISPARKKALRALI